MNGKIGVIGKSGKFYECSGTEHIETALANKHDSPFVCLYDNIITFDAFYTVDHTEPTREQFETVMDWCTKFGEIFEDVTECFNLPWERWRTKL